MPKKKSTEGKKTSLGNAISEGSSMLFDKVKSSVKKSVKETMKELSKEFFDKMILLVGIIFIAISVTILLSWFVGPALSFLIVGIVILIWSKLRR